VCKNLGKMHSEARFDTVLRRGTGLVVTGGGNTDDGPSSMGVPTSNGSRGKRNIGGQQRREGGGLIQDSCDTSQGGKRQLGGMILWGRVDKRRGLGKGGKASNFSQYNDLKCRHEGWGRGIKKKGVNDGKKRDPGVHSGNRATGGRGGGNHRTGRRDRRNDRARRETPRPTSDRGQRNQ